MNKWIRGCIATGCFISALTIGYHATKTQDVLTERDVQLWQQTDKLYATSKPPDWKPIGIAIALIGVGTGCYHLYKVLGLESQQTTPGQPGQQPPSSPNSPTSPTQPIIPIDAVKGANDRRLEEFWMLLNQPETKWVLCLLEPPALLVKGGQGAFKTTFVGFLILLRKLYCGHSLEVSDPHAHQNEDKWFACRLVGHEQNYAAIAAQLSHYYKRLKTRNLNSPPITSVWDEYTNYATRIPGNGVEDFLFSVLSDARKAREFLILISHTDKKGGTGNSKRTGEHEMKEEQLLTLHLKAERDTFGHPRPAFRGFIKGYREDDDGNPIREPVQLQPWMNSQYLIQLFPELSYREKSDVISSELPMPKPWQQQPNQQQSSQQLNQQPNQQQSSQQQSNQQQSSQQPPSQQQSSQQSPNNPQISWDYWVAESTEEEINKLIAERRYRSEFLSDNWMGQVPDNETSPKQTQKPQSNPSEASQSPRDESHVSGMPPNPPSIPPISPVLWDESQFAKYFPDVTELELFEEILSYLDVSRNASDIIKNVLRCKRHEPDSHRSYSNVGKPCFCYLIRKYAPPILIAHFADFLDKKGVDYA
ncbi:hypothetical protein [Kamptonema sp. UHCC 0994]|uniref:hypothetical protein n=1 Tax=Kamptonema sp. UHCC 0994 TaxID=3031329 RepID=UPI0023BA480F|nr:hypothetical protein [Kamptonema sp. UHCC 0994]MDF0556300.1 hypothetical protein [Kamptonema sp. UHCC 0994]